MSTADVIISQATAERRYASIFAELKDVSTSRTAARLLGARHDVILAALFRHVDTLQSHTRTCFARLDDEIVGHVTCVPSEEFVVRQRTTLAEVRRLSPLAGLRLYFHQALRRLKRTRLGPTAPAQLHIASLAVRSDLRRRGIATALLAHACNAAVAAAHYQLSLDVAATNHAAVAFYRANGFRVAAARRGGMKLIKTLGSAPMQP